MQSLQDISGAAIRKATIIRTGPGLYLALVKDGSISRVWACKLRGKLRSRLERERDAVYVGEEVTIGQFEVQPGITAGTPVAGAAVIDSLLPRRTALTRLAPPPWPGATLLKQTLAVNIDLVMAVVAAAAPPLRIGTIDRYLLLAAQAGLESAVCINKADRAAGGQELKHMNEVRASLESRGARVFVTSAETGQGVPELHRFLVGRTSVFTGPSGVGKTSILKAMCPGLDAKTLSISSSNNKGRHSTTYSSLIDIGGGYVADLPGLRAVSFWNLEADVVMSEFSDIREIARDCQFSDCSHGSEPGCAVQAAIEDGLLSEERFREYLRCVRDAKKSRAGQERVAQSAFRPEPSRRVARRVSIEAAMDDESDDGGGLPPRGQ